MNFNIDDNSSNNESGSNRGKFSERLNRIRIQRLKYKKYGVNILDKDENRIITFGRNILKIILVLPSVVYSHVIIKDKKNDINKQKLSGSNNNDEVNSLIDENILCNDNISKIKVNKIKNINISLLRKKKEDLVRNINSDFVKNIKLESDLVIDLKKEKLQKEIVNLIKKRLIKNINELEILYSELYVLKELGVENIYLSECQNDIKEIKKLLSKVNSLKEKYDYLKDNIDFQYMLEYDENFLIDKIIELKEMCSSNDIKYVIDDYKILDEYKYLYLKIDKFEEDIIKFEEEKNKKALELKQRDIDFDKFKNEVFNIDKSNEKYNNFVKLQEEFLKQLEERILKIDSYEKVNYRLKGFDKLLENSFKYLGLLLVNPLKGLIPSIATQTVVTKNIVHNLYNNLSWEEDKRMVYDAIDYSLTISNAINDLDYTTSLVDSTLEEIVLLKDKYKKDFDKYSLDISSYKDTIKKLNKIENAVLGSKVKIETMKVKMKEKEIVNNKKMKMVKKLNESANTSSN